MSTHFGALLAEIHILDIGNEDNFFITLFVDLDRLDFDTIKQITLPPLHDLCRTRLSPTKATPHHVSPCLFSAHHRALCLQLSWCHCPARPKRGSRDGSGARPD